MRAIAAAPDRQGSGWAGVLGSERRLPGVARRLVLLYVVVVALIWRAERAPLALGQVGELAEARDAAESGKHGHDARCLLMVLAGVVAMAAGATARLTPCGVSAPSTPSRRGLGLRSSALN